MPAIETLQSIASLLPDEQRERFLAVVAKFREVPDEDEILQMLEAIGFMTLLWREVPEQIKTILEGATAPAIETTHSVTGAMREVINDAIPSYEDLKVITQRLEEHELALKNTLMAKSGAGQRSPSWILGSAIFTTGVLVGLMAYACLLPLMP